MSDARFIALDFAENAERWRMLAELEQDAAPGATAFITDQRPANRFALPSFAEQFQLAEEAAALSGTFHPGDVVESTESDVGQSVLSQLISDCTVETHDGRALWVLQQHFGVEHE